MILAIFDQQVTLMLPIKFRANWPFGSREEGKNRFSRLTTMAAILDFRLGRCLLFFNLQVTPMLPNKVLSQLAFRFR